MCFRKSVKICLPLANDYGYTEIAFLGGLEVL
jgi:hypothetical protein